MMFEFLTGKKKKVKRLLEEGRFTELQELNYKITSYLKDFLKENDYRLVKNVVIFSAMIKDNETVSELISLTHCEDQRLQRLSSIALAQIGTEKAVKSLVDNLMSDNPVFREYAEEAIINYLNKDAIYYISRALISSDTYVKLVCLKALASVGRDTYLHENIINPIIQLLKDKSSKIRSEAAYTLGTIKYEDAIDKLISLLDDPMPSVREAAIDAISRFNTEKAFSAFLKGIKNSHDYVKIVSAEKIEGSENLLVLHSACLEIPGKKEGFLVLGSSNTGKSLTAFSFLQNGFQFLSDDMTVLFPPTAYACPFSSGCYSYLSPKDITGRLNQFFLSLPLLGLFVPNLQVRRVFDLLLKRYQVSPKTTVRQIFILERGDKKGVEKLDKEKSFRKIITLNRLELSYFKDHFLYAYSYFNPDFDLNRLLRQEERLVKALVSFCSCFLVRSNNPRDYFSLIKQKLNDF